MVLALGLSFSAGTLMWLLFLFASFAAVGFLAGRWWGLFALAFAGIALVAFLIINDGIYGHGWGEDNSAWWIAGPAMLVFGGASVGLLLRRGWDSHH